MAPLADTSSVLNANMQSTFNTTTMGFASRETVVTASQLC